jgi:hypothetical protein
MLRSATVLVRPHPTLARRWHEREFEREPNVVMSPSTLDAQINSESFRARYRAELHHASLTVGINTSGFIDGAIFGKPACTVELEELFHGQRGTVHFQHLARPDGGLLHVAQGFDAHVSMLAELIRREPYAHDERSMQFVRAFVRPHGLDVSPREIFVEKMLELCSAPAGVRRRSPSRSLAQRALSTSAIVLGAPLQPRPLRGPLEYSVKRGARAAHKAVRVSRRSSRRALRLSQRAKQLGGRVTRIAWRGTRQTLVRVAVRRPVPSSAPASEEDVGPTRLER